VELVCVGHPSLNSAATPIRSEGYLTQDEDHLQFYFIDHRYQLCVGRTHAVL